MGICQSRSQAVVVTKADGERRAAELNHDQINQRVDPAPSSASFITVGTSSTAGIHCVDSSDQHDHQDDKTAAPADPEETKPAGEVSMPILPTDVTNSIPDLDLEITPRKFVSSKSNHKRNRSDQVIDYLKSEGPSSNRVMVHIETALGVRIEEVYDGVHDGDVLGEGITGKVRKITHKETGIQRALKRLDLDLVTREEDLNRLLEEVKIMCALDHPNIVCLEEVYEGDSELYLTQELCDGGDLFDRLEDQSNYSYTEAEAARIIKQIISSVLYLHSKNIIHRDLKLENFLYSDRESNSDLKMIDFGLSKHFELGEVQHELVGTPYTVAPEVILEQGYDEKCDVWAIGVIAYLLLSGATPFGGDDPADDLLQVRENIVSGHVPFDPSVWASVSDLAISFIKDMLILDPEKRPSAEEAQNHPWLQLMKRHSSISEEETHLDPRVVNGLVSFKELSSTRKFLSEVLSFTLQPAQIAGLREEFEKMDVNGKGEISLDGLKSALLARSGQCLLTEAEIEEIFNGLKVRNTDLSIRWHEFIAACLSQCHIDDRNIRLAFDRLDTDRKGFITLNDLKAAMDFYGSDCRSDLQNMWINNVMDYKSEKENMTYDDFYKLLKLERNGNPATVTPKPVKPFRSDRSANSLVRSFTVSSQESKLADAFATVSFDDVVGSHIRTSRRLSLDAILDEDEDEQDFIANLRAHKSMKKIILEGSKRVEEGRKTNAEEKGNHSNPKGLLLRRESCEFKRSCLRRNSSSN